MEKANRFQRLLANLDQNQGVVDELEIVKPSTLLDVTTPVSQRVNDIILGPSATARTIQNGTIFLPQSFQRNEHIDGVFTSLASTGIPNHLRVLYHELIHREQNKHIQEKPLISRIIKARSLKSITASVLTREIHAYIADSILSKPKPGFDLLNFPQFYSYITTYLPELCQNLIEAYQLNEDDLKQLIFLVYSQITLLKESSVTNTRICKLIATYKKLDPEKGYLPFTQETERLDLSNNTSLSKKRDTLLANLKKGA